MSDVTVINGKPCASLNARDRGLAYGHGVFETMRLYRREIPLWRRHKNRLARGLEVLGIPFDPAFVEGSIDELLRHLTDNRADSGVVKLTVTAGVNTRGYAVQQPLVPTVIAQWGPLPSSKREAVRLHPCHYRLPINPHLAGIKHLNRLDQVLAAMEVTGDDVPLLLDSAGRVVESLSHNIFVFDGLRWLTPDLQYCGVAGVMRELLLEKVLPEVAETVEVSTFGVELLTLAEEVFICNSVTGVQCVAGLAVKGNDYKVTRTDLIRQKLGESYPCFTA